MQRAVRSSTAAAATAAAATPSTHPLVGSLDTTQSKASDVEELYGPLPPFKGPKVARSHSETAAPPLPDRQPGQPPPPPEEAPKQQRRPPAAAPPKPQQPPQAKPPPQPAKPPPPRSQQPAPKPAPAGAGAKAGASAPSPAGSCKFPPGQHTFPYEELKGMRADSGIDMARKEDYLSDAEFQRMFKMDRSAFRDMKRWRQLEKKKDVGLF